MKTIAKSLVVGVAIAVAVLWTKPAQAEVADISGTWKLNVEKSDFGKRPKPKSATLKLEHKEPSIKYTVTGTAGDGKPMKIDFSGTLDGKDYPVHGSPFAAKSNATRVNNSTTKGVSTSSDGKTVETYTVTISKDGKTLTRKATVKGPDGEFTTLAIYDKQ
jgi:hypothetical protein